jgi:hypothetical protein
LCRLLVAFLVGAVVAHPSTAAGEPSQDKRVLARDMMSRGDAALDARRFEDALVQFKAAHDLMNVPTTGVAVVHALNGLRRLREAYEVARRTALTIPTEREPEAYARARVKAARMVRDLEDRIPTLAVVIQGPRETVARVRVDGSELTAEAVARGVPLDPGKHDVIVAAPGYRTARRFVELQERDRKTEAFTLDPLQGSSAPADTSPKERVGGPSSYVYAGFGVGAAGLVVGSVTGILSMTKASDVLDQCSGNRCPVSTKDDVDSSKSLATVSNISFGVGIVGIGVGVAALLAGSSDVASRREKQAAARRLVPVLSPSGVGLTGQF